MNMPGNKSKCVEKSALARPGVQLLGRNHVKNEVYQHNQLRLLKDTEYTQGCH